MHFLLVVLQLLLERLFPSGRDGLTMAARSDGRVEQVPADFWSRFCQWWRQPASRSEYVARKCRGLADAARTPRRRT